MTAEPTEPPASGPAVEQPPHREDDRPRATVYKHPRPALWVYWPDRWVYARVLARQDYQDGHTAYQVEIPLPGERSLGYRTFVWHPDRMRPA